MQSQVEAYAQFLRAKAITDPATGLIGKTFDLPEMMFPFQHDVTAWALRRGRSALFAGTGLGKTLMELAWGREIERETQRPILHFAPLAVSAQIVREAQKFGVPARLVASKLDCEPGTICVTNYQKLQHFDVSDFGASILDESSILKSVDGHYRTELIDHCSIIPFRLAATATPAPNDFMELGNHAEFLGVMSYTDMLATFFVHDGGDTQKWRLKGHAEDEFWKWMASWAVMLRKPSDLGYSDEGYDLPPLVYHSHTVEKEHDPSATGTLFAIDARTLSERITARRDSVEDRVAKAVSIVTADFWAKLATCQKQDGSPSTRPTDWIALQTIRSTLLDMKSSVNAASEPQRKTKNTCENTTEKTGKNFAGPQSSRPRSTPPAGKNTQPIQSTEKSKKRPSVKAVASQNETLASREHSESLSISTLKSYPAKMADALFAEHPTEIVRGVGCTSTTATKLASFEDCSAPTAISDSESSETTVICSTGQLNISAKPILDRWVIWCHLNSEQDALEKAFGDLCLSARGSKTDDENERIILSWLDGDRPILLGKPSMLGFGLNLQCCHKCIFVGLNDSWEQFYQAVRRFWRFGQTEPVDCHIVSSAQEGNTVANIQRKEAQADRMAANMVAHMSDLSRVEIQGSSRQSASYIPTEKMDLPTWLS